MGFLKEIPAPFDLYQIYNNLLIELTITATLASYYFIQIWYVQISTCAYCAYVSSRRPIL